MVIVASLARFMIRRVFFAKIVGQRNRSARRVRTRKRFPYILCFMAHMKLIARIVVNHNIKNKFCNLDGGAQQKRCNGEMKMSECSECNDIEYCGRWSDNDNNLACPARIRELAANKDIIEMNDLDRCYVKFIKEKQRRFQSLWELGLFHYLSNLKPLPVNSLGGWLHDQFMMKARGE